MASSTTKRVLVRRFEREPLMGFVNPQSYLHASGIELLTPGGAVLVLPYEEVKIVCFVKDFDAAGQPPAKRIFHTRPKIDGLWVRLIFRDKEILDGILPNNLLQLDAYGFTVTPPDANSSHQRLFVPRAALTELQVLGVIGSPLRQRKAKPVPAGQIELFEK